jgi:polar amino acid transport system substrate-binding protein
MNETAAPGTFLSDGKLTGYQYDIETAAATALGATIKWVNEPFADIIPGVQSGKYDIATGTDVTAAREQVVDIVPMVQAGYSFLTLAKGGTTVGDSMSDLCGLKIGLVSGQSETATLQAQSSACVKAGKKAITLLTFTDDATEELAVKAGRADVVAVYTGSAGWNIKQDPSWKLTGPTFSVAESGFSIKKGSDLGSQFVKEINAMIADGSYAKILAKYGVSNIAITKATLNPAA